MRRKYYVSSYISDHLKEFQRKNPKAGEWEKYYSVIGEIFQGGTTWKSARPWGNLRIQPSTSVSFACVVTVYDYDGKYDQEYKFYNPNFTLLDWFDSTVTSCEWSDMSVHQQIDDFASFCERNENVIS